MVNTKSTMPRRHRKVGIPKFLRSLRKILTTENPSIIRWSTSGQSIEIHDMQLLTMTILPKYFKHQNYKSFQRQLNYFGFRKWTKRQTNVCTFSHTHFLRSQPNDLCHIKRQNHRQTTKETSTICVDELLADPLAQETDLFFSLDLTYEPLFIF